MIDPNTAILIASLGASLASIVVAGISAYAAIKSALAANASKEVSVANSVALSEIVPTLAKLETNTNSNTATIKALAEKEGIQIGEARATAKEEARAAGLKDGQAQPQTPPAVEPVDGK